ncbi:MAG TPA: CoA pyrophosphatase [Sorangium sp.]|nr:CoA pyrophosphatase [Sorangium sp.]
MFTAPPPQQISAALRHHQRVELGPMPGRSNHIHGAVLLPLLYRNEQLCCVATVRALHMRNYAGEVCFPGGLPEARDADLQTTALREAQEEIALHNATILGELSSIPLYTSDHRIFPFVAHAPAQRLVPNPSEVAQVLYLSINDIMRLPYIDGLAWKNRNISGMAPVFDLDGALMYGATAHAFYELLTIVAGLSQRQPPPLKPGRFSWSDVLPHNVVPPDPSRAVT